MSTTQSPADSFEAIVIVFGVSPAVLARADDLVGELKQRLAIGDRFSNTNVIADVNSVIVKLPLSGRDDASALAETEQWLRRHATIVQSTDARKILEIRTFLDSDTGSRTLTVPNAVVRLCGELGLDIAHQAMKVFTRAEYDAMRSKPDGDEP